MWRTLQPVYRVYSLMGEAWEAGVNYFAYFMEHIPASAWITDAGGIMRYANACYYQTFKVPPNIIGMSVYDLYPQAIADTYAANIKYVAKHHEAMQIVEPGEKPGGEAGFFLVYKFPIVVNETETLVGGVAIDITHQKEAEARALELARVTEANKIKEAFFMSLSHDMRNPLASILMTVNALERELEELEEMPDLANAIKRYLHIITHECTNELTLIDALLQIQQIETNLYPLIPIPIKIKDWLLDCLSQLEPRMAAKALKIATHLPDDLPLMSVDPTALSRIVGELLQNAYKYTHPHGLIEIAAHAEGDQMQINISNTGELSADILDRIFEPFFRLHRIKANGFGLGLNLIRDLATYLNGTLVASAQAGRITFTLQLPLQGKEYREV